MADEDVKEPPRARAARWPILLAALLGVVAGGGVMWLALHPARDAHGAPDASHEAHAATELWQCPMHPSVIQDHPGTCPICNMKLVKVSQPAAARPDAGRTVAFYRSPMNPKQTSPVPAKDEMGMDYLPVYSDELGGGGASVKGLAPISIDAERQQLIGLRTALVEKGPVSERWRTVGRVEVDPTRVRKTNLKVEGYVERVFVDFIGRPVRRGEPLFSLYSPALLSAQNEYLLALQTREQLSKGGALTDDGDALVKSVRRKLELWDVPAGELARLEQTKEPSRTLTFVSPISGVVTAKNVVEGARLAPGDTPYEITDLSMVWVMADAYESDLARVKTGMPATLTLAAWPGKTFKGDVAFIDPLLDPNSRTVKVHLHFPNPGGELKPEMFGEVELQGIAREGLRVPADSIVRAGTRDVVFVALGAGKFEPREVKLGGKAGDTIEVIDGLSAGEQVVTRANFLVDSESQLRSSLQSLGSR